MPEEFVDLGCGNDTRDGHLGLDVRLYDAVDIQGDARSLPLADASVKRVRSSQLLEHLDGNEELPALFEEVYRVLEPGGQFVFDVPFGRTWGRRPDPQTKVDVQNDRLLSPARGGRTARMVIGTFPGLLRELRDRVRTRRAERSSVAQC